MKQWDKFVFHKDIPVHIQHTNQTSSGFPDRSKFNASSRTNNTKSENDSKQSHDEDNADCRPFKKV
jgi:hypothetical protein